MRPLYDARVSDLGPGDLVKVECACGHAELLTAAMLATAGVAPDLKVADLSRRCAAASATSQAGDGERARADLFAVCLPLPD
jgi:hypothetical protein